MKEKWQWAGSRWWKFDFHSHTPASEDYGRGPDQKTLKNHTPREWILDYMRAGIDCVAITDHNSGGWIDKLKEEYKKMKDEDHSEYQPLYLFPGVEISVIGGIHVLAIFSKDKSKSDIDGLLCSVGYNGEKGKCDTCTSCSTVEVIKKIEELGGLAIPAHADEKNGLFKLKGNDLEKILETNNIIAMELCDPSCKRPEKFKEKKVKCAEVVGSDQHHPNGKDGQRYPGSHYTWIKMSEPDLEGLHLALLDGDMSVMRFDEVEKDPNQYGPMMIESIEIENAQYIGCDQPLVCNLNPWLNTIIGGRGTGKSTILEFTRQLFRREDELPEELIADHEKYTKVNGHRDDVGLLKVDTLLTAVYRRDGRRFRIQWNYEGSINPIQEIDDLGQSRKTEGKVSNRFPIRIYSQKQIFGLARDHQALLKVIDDSMGTNYIQWINRKEELQSNYLSLKAQCRDIMSSLERIPDLQGELDDIKNKLKLFEKVDHAKVLKEFQLRQRQKNTIEDWENSWKDASDELKRFSENVIPSNMDDSLFDENDETDRELLEKVEDITNNLQGIRDKIIYAATRIEKEYDHWTSTKPSLKISSRVIEARTNYENIQKELQKTGSSNPDEYGLLVQRRRNLEEQMKKLENRKESLKDLEKQSRSILDKIALHRKELQRMRSEFLSTTLKNNKYVEMELVPFGDTSNVEKEFRALINKEDRYEKDIGSPDGDEGLLYELFNGDQKEIQTRLDSLKRRINDIRKGDIKGLRDVRFADHVKSLPPENIDRLMCWFPKDRLDVRYRSDPKSDWKSIREGSPGQKTAALLAFILSYGDEPLIMDQPEDDLDNHLIYDLVVRQLKNMKQRRQIIIVTHNANIVVNGDSENVIALDTPHGQTRISIQGSLQEPGVRKEICEIMEGGSEAFNMRYRRIKAGGSDV